MSLTIFESWIFLVIAIALSVFGTICMKLSHGLRKIRPTLFVGVSYMLAFVAMTFALKHIELSILYAVWSGLGTVLVATIGILYFNESVSLKKIIFLMVIVLGVIGLHLSNGH